MKYSFRWSRNKTRIKKKLEMMKRFQWRYKNLILLAFSVIFAGYIIKSEYISKIVLGIGSFGYPSSFFVGALFSYGITTAPAAATLYLLGRNLNFIVITIIATVGAVMSDFIIFNFIRRGVLKDVKRISWRFNIDISMRREMMRRKKLMKFLPVIAGLIVASPLPHEVATLLFASVDYDRTKFLQYSSVFNFFSILVITSVGKVL